MQATKQVAFLALLLQTATSFDASQRRHPMKTMALQVTRVEQAMGNGLRRLYRLPKLTTAPSKARRSADHFSDRSVSQFD